MLADIGYGTGFSKTPEAVQFDFQQVGLRILDPDLAADFYTRPGGPTLRGTDHDVRQWVGNATLLVVQPEQGGRIYRARLSDGRTMLVYPKPDQLGELSVEDWLTGKLRLNRAH